MAQQPAATNIDPKNLPPVKVAFIIDGEVVDVLHTDNRLGAIFLSEPLIVDVSDLVKEGQLPSFVGKLYNEETKEFTDKPQA
jgi:hypothetical protein